MGSGDELHRRQPEVLLSPVFPFDQLANCDDPEGPQALLGYDVKIRIPRRLQEYREIITELGASPTLARELAMQHGWSPDDTEATTLALIQLRNQERVHQAYDANSSSPPPECDRVYAALFYGANENATWPDIAYHMGLYYTTRAMLMEAAFPASGPPQSVNQMLATAAAKAQDLVDARARRLLAFTDSEKP